MKMTINPYILKILTAQELLSNKLLSNNQTFNWWLATHDMWHMVEGEHSLKISASQLLRFGIDSALKILN